MSDVSDLSKSVTDTIAIESCVEKLLSTLPSQELSAECKLSGEEGVVFYVAGYIARSILKKNKCESCQSLLIQSLSSPEICFADEDSGEKNAKTRMEFLQSVDRGGLVTPSELVYLTCMHALQLKKEVFDGGNVQKTFLSFTVPRDVFVSTLVRKISNTPDCASTLNQACEESHEFMTFVPQITKQFFNCVSKNFISGLNDTIHEGRKRGPQHPKDSQGTRKIAKLQSQS